MKKLCSNLQERLADAGARSLEQDASAQEHLTHCDDCFRFLEALRQVDDGLTSLEEHEPPSDLTDSVLESVRTKGIEFADQTPELSRQNLIQKLRQATRRTFEWIKPYLRSRKVQILIGAALVCWLASRGQSRPSDQIDYSDEWINSLIKTSFGYIKGAFGALAMLLMGLGTILALMRSRFRLSATFASLCLGMFVLRSSVATFFDISSVESGYSPADADFIRSDPEVINYNDERITAMFPRWLSTLIDPELEGSSQDEKSHRSIGIDFGTEEITDQRAGPAGSSRDMEAARRDSKKAREALDKVKGKVPAVHRDNVLKRELAKPETYEDSYAPIAENLLRDEEISRLQPAEPSLERPGIPQGFLPMPSPDPFSSLFADRSKIEGLQFKAARGYWANTYLPGDPELINLATRLAELDRSALKTRGGKPLLLEDGIERVPQPFDLPQNAALALYLHSDKTAVEAKTRMLLQVGLQATRRQSGSRPAMNVGIVLDLSGNSQEDGNLRQNVEALLQGFVKAYEAGDRFSLTVAGRPGGLLIKPGEYRHGTVTVALKEIFANEAGNAAPTLTTAKALEEAISTVRSGDDPASALGSSVVVLVSGRSLVDQVSALSRLAHESAVGGIQVSTMGLGTGADEASLRMLALAGQGNRRILSSPREAEELVQKELSAVSRTVARAIRLNIRLAPQVKLVDVLGSYSLDEAAAQRVRDAEKSVDLRVARNLGIEADRGEDEDGIQMLIPVFYSGDAHVILLDVVAEGPGTIAEVTAKYKDLVFLRNGTDRANLSLGYEKKADSPLEQNVAYNFLAYQMSEVLRTAGGWLETGQSPEATLALMRSYAGILASTASLPAPLGAGKTLARDRSVIGEYSELLSGSSSLSIEQREQLAMSLEYAGRIKVSAPPNWE